MILKKLWIISQNSYAPYMNAGTRHYGIGKELVKKDVKVQLFTSSFNHKTLRESRKYKGVQLFQKENIDGVEFIWIRTFPYKKNDGLDRIFSMVMFALTVTIVCVFFRQFKRPDIIAGSSPTLIPAFAACCLAKLLRVPFLFEIRDLWPQTIIEFHPERANHPMIKMFFKMEKFCLDNAAKIAGLLPGIPLYFKTRYEGKFVDSFFWLPNGVDSAQISDRINVNPTCNNVVYLGALSQANAITSLLLVAERCMELTFNFYGSGTEKDALINMAQRMGLTNVIFHHPIPKNSIDEVLNNADVLIATLKNSDLYQYGISLNKLYDYMAAGKPVVFGVSAFNDPVAEANAGISVKPEDDAAMADALRQIARLTQDERQQLGVNGKDFIRKNHTFEILSDRLLNELRSLA